METALQPRSEARPASPAGGAKPRVISILLGVLAPIACFGAAWWIGIFERYGAAVYVYALLVVPGLAIWLLRAGRDARLDALLAGILAPVAFVGAAFAIRFFPFALVGLGEAAALHEPVFGLMGLLALLPLPAAFVFAIHARRAWRSARSQSVPHARERWLAGALAPLLLCALAQLGVWRIDRACSRAMLAAGPAAVERIGVWKPLASILPLTELLEGYARETEDFTRSTPRSLELERAYEQFKGIDHLSFKSQRHAGSFGRVREW